MSHPFASITRHEPLAERIYSTLRQHIRSGLLPSGRALTEVTLAEQLGTSRTPVRVALVRLASEGLVVQDGRGFTVPVLSDSDIEEIYELRFLLEPPALRLVAGRTRANSALLKPLTRELSEMTAAHKSNDGAAFMEANYRYRDAWTCLVPSRRMVKAIEMYADHVRYLRAFTLDDPAVRTIVLQGLQELTDALALGDGAGAARAMHAHLSRGKNILVGRAAPAGTTGD